MLQKNFDAELTIKAGVEQFLQDFPFHLLLLLLLQMSQKLLICWLFVFVLGFFFPKRHQVRLHLFPLP